jgi:hypothetical protein
VDYRNYVVNVQFAIVKFQVYFPVTEEALLLLSLPERDLQLLPFALG